MKKKKLRARRRIYRINCHITIGLKDISIDIID
uniref:Ribosomal protein L22 n=1 Tax=Brachystegia bakeriana TaxID=2818402 RepID=A0A8A2XUF0_9FABA|nr:ribosomal protein L22 [Brachystegia bakeriana]QSX28189.1 ribosomal protein L22 [Brachystegia bakeriana]